MIGVRDSARSCRRLESRPAIDPFESDPFESLPGGVPPEVATAEAAIEEAVATCQLSAVPTSGGTPPGSMAGRLSRRRQERAESRTPITYIEQQARSPVAGESAEAALAE